MARIGDPRSRGKDQPLIVSAGIVVLAAAVLICIGLVAIPLWTAVVHGWQFQPVADRCSILMDDPSRQACYEQLRLEESRHPAKGANAPIMLRSGERQSD
jgi:hypothetical protein